MKRVPRETLSNGPAVRPILFRKYLREANAAGIKDTTRRILGPDNCEVQPGKFGGLNLETGRVRTQNLMRAELRAQCTFESGRVRVVSVFPIVRPGDLFYVKDGRYGSRKASNQTLEVRRVRVARLQDMTTEDCMREGTACLPLKFQPLHGDTRLGFARLWEDLNGPASWSLNPWVWIYEYTTHPTNVDDLLAQRQK